MTDSTTQGVGHGSGGGGAERAAATMLKLIFLIMLTNREIRAVIPALFTQCLGIRKGILVFQWLKKS